MLDDRETRLALKIVLITAAVVILIWALVRLAPIISIIIIALFLVYCINPLVNFLIKIRFKPILAAMVSSLLILLTVFLLFYLLIPGLILEMRQLLFFLTTEFTQDLPKLISQLEELDNRLIFSLQILLSNTPINLSGRPPVIFSSCSAI